MGISLSTAKIVAPISWAYMFLSQQYAIAINDPGMKAVNDRNPGAFNPTPFAIGAWFGPQQILEVLYLKELYYPSGGKLEAITLDLAPYFTLGNLMIGTWPFFWNAEKLKLADMFVIVNTAITLYWVYARRAPRPNTWQQKLANAVGVSFAGIGVMDFLQNTAMAFYTRQPPSELVKWATVIGFPLASLLSPVSMGLSFIFCQTAITIGQYQLANRSLDGFGGGGGFGWAKMLGLGAIATAAATGLKYNRDGGRIL